PAQMLPSMLSAVNAEDEQKIFGSVYLYALSPHRQCVEIFPKNFGVHLQRIFFDCDAPVEFEVDSQVLAYQKKILLYIGRTQWHRRFVAAIHEYGFGFRYTVFRHNNVEVTELPKRNLSINCSGQDRSFVWNGRYVVLSELDQNLEQFGSEKQITFCIRVKRITQPVHGPFRYAIGVRVRKRPVDERQHAMRVRGFDEEVPV